jgi:septum site-determining protein MinC
VSTTAASPAVDFRNPAELFQIRGQLYTLISLRVIEPDDHQFFMELHKAIGRAPDFFRHAPVVIDVGQIVERPPINLAEFGRRLRQLQLVPVGLQNGDEAWNKMAVNAGLGLFPPGRPTSGAGQDLPAGEEAPRPARPEPPTRPANGHAPARPAAPAALAGGTTKVITEPVRAGQQIYAQGGDLVALAPVSPGAELLADGHIHVYSSLHGRAHAGIGGNDAARIFCNSLRAQLISIAGIYLVNEEIDERFLGQRVQIRCQNETIVMEALP